MLGIDDPGFDSASTLTGIADWASSAALTGGDLDSVWEVGAPVTEHALYRWAARTDEPAVIPAALLILVLIAIRIGAPAVQMAYADDWDICLDGGVSRLALNRFFSQWRRHRMASMTLAEAARWLLSDYVIRQHERVAIAKLAQTGDTFRFRRQGDQLRFYEADAPP